MRKSSVPETFYQPEDLSELWHLYGTAYEILAAAYLHLAGADFPSRSVLLDKQREVLAVCKASCVARMLDRRAA